MEKKVREGYEMFDAKRKEQEALQADRLDSEDFAKNKLPLAYDFLVGLADKESSEISPQLNFMLLPLNEQRRIMAQQAEHKVSHYKETAHESSEWQAGDFIDEY